MTRPILDVVLGPEGAAATRTAIPTRILMVATYAVKTLKTFTVIVSTLSIKTFMNNIHCNSNLLPYKIIAIL